jgi:hypothetical protein
MSLEEFSRYWEQVHGGRGHFIDHARTALFVTEEREIRA